MKSIKLPPCLGSRPTTLRITQTSVLPVVIKKVKDTAYGYKKTKLIYILYVQYRYNLILTVKSMARTMLCLQTH